ncbi:MAG TPA: peptidoglycan-binding protein [Prosthecobacter sp.]|nr:peptidoglycan-binding protein [Prosthecobacter sp.]
MKPSNCLKRLLATAAVGASCVAAVPQESQAQSPYWGPRPEIRRDWDRDHLRRSYYSVPRSNFVITFGTGYAGRGYYYGPPGSNYFYEAPGVRFFRSRSLVPTHYWSRRPITGPHQVMVRGSMDARVQSELARRGYYRGPIDGDIGPGSRAAIARFQADHGLAVTGSISGSLLSALGLY